MGIVTKLQLLKYRRTKIVATLGPRSSDQDTIRALIEAGVNVFRLNMSHGTHALHRATFDNICAAREACGRTVAILADLSGPKIRTGRFAGGSIELAGGARVTVTTRQVQGAPGLIASQYEALARDVREGDRILLDDGNLELRVEVVEGTEIAARVIHGGVLKDNKGMNLPGVAVSAPALTDKDRDDARFAMGLGVDFIALSFVRRAADVQTLRALVHEHDRDVSIVAKIEKPEALEEIDAILDVSDAIMVARGDLGVELPPERVPIAQDALIDRARAHDIPVIVATQMLESMIQNARPTRAEVTDVANAVRSGADAVMLSAETATGAHPIEAVKTMDVIARQTEAYLWSQGAFGTITERERTARPVDVGDAIAEAAARLSRDLRVRATAVITHGGRSAAVTSASRPAAPIVVTCATPRASRLASLSWGVIPFPVAEGELNEPEPLARKMVAELGLAAPGDMILVVRGFSSDPRRHAPSITVLTV